MCMLKWDELPQEMQLSEVKPYYQLVSRRKGSLVLNENQSTALRLQIKLTWFEEISKEY